MVIGKGFHGNRTERGGSTFGVIYGNRDFFPDPLISEARREMSSLLERLSIRAIQLSVAETKLGGVETHTDARKCADLFKRHAEELDGILVVLPNFGDEKGVLDTIVLSGLDLPILVHAFPDNHGKMNVAQRRDAFCGKISVCNNLHQRGIKFSLTTRHVMSPEDPDLIVDIQRFQGVCRVVRGMRRARLGAVGARPGAFNTVRYSEKLLERNGISVTTVDLSEILGKADALGAGDSRVKSQLNAIREYADASMVPPEPLLQMARLGVVLYDFIDEHALDATAIQCWTSIQKNHGCNACTSMSMMSEQFVPSACEVDVTGTLTMLAMQLASGTPAALVDWNNNYGEDADRCVLFHCGNWAKSFLPEVRISTAPILGTVVGENNTYGALEGRTAAGPLTYGRISTDDARGVIKAYVGEGRLTDDTLNTFGSRAVAQIPNLQLLMRHICLNGFEHHSVMTVSHTAEILNEALGNYLGWEVHLHSLASSGEASDAASRKSDVKEAVTG